MAHDATVEAAPDQGRAHMWTGGGGGTLNCVSWPFDSWLGSLGGSCPWSLRVRQACIISAGHTRPVPPRSTLQRQSSAGWDTYSLAEHTRLQHAARGAGGSRENSCNHRQAALAFEPGLDRSPWPENAYQPFVADCKGFTSYSRYATEAWEARSSGPHSVDARAVQVASWLVTP
jgi:hypothetical protein